MGLVIRFLAGDRLIPLKKNSPVTLHLIVKVRKLNMLLYSATRLKIDLLNLTAFHKNNFFNVFSGLIQDGDFYVLVCFAIRDGKIDIDFNLKQNILIP